MVPRGPASTCTAYNLGRDAYWANIVNVPREFLHFWGCRLVHTQPLCCAIVAIPVIMLREDCEAVHADNNFAAYDVLYNVR